MANQEELLNKIHELLKQREETKVKLDEIEAQLNDFTVKEKSLDERIENLKEKNKNKEAARSHLLGYIHEVRPGDLIEISLEAAKELFSYDVAGWQTWGEVVKDDEYSIKVDFLYFKPGKTAYTVDITRLQIQDIVFYYRVEDIKVGDWVLPEKHIIARWDIYDPTKYYKVSTISHTNEGSVLIGIEVEGKFREFFIRDVKHRKVQKA